MTTVASIIFYLIASLASAVLGVEIEKNKESEARQWFIIFAVFFLLAAGFQILG